VSVIAGGADKGIDEAYDLGVTSIFSINRLPEAFETSRYKSVENITFAVDNILRLIKSVNKV
jgi:glycerate kinase